MKRTKIRYEWLAYDSGKYAALDGTPYHRSPGGVTMSLYRLIDADGDDWYAEADSYGDALDAWVLAAAPEEFERVQDYIKHVELLSTEPVIRQASEGRRE